MTTKTDQDVRYWPTEKALAALAEDDPDRDCSRECLLHGHCNQACPPIPLPLEDE